MNASKEPLNVGYEYLSTQSNKTIDETFDWLFSKARSYFDLTYQAVTTVSGVGPCSRGR
jgi:hypothetical protein